MFRFVVFGLGLCATHSTRLEIGVKIEGIDCTVARLSVAGAKENATKADSAAKKAKEAADKADAEVLRLKNLLKQAESNATEAQKKAKALETEANLSAGELKNLNNSWATCIDCKGYAGPGWEYANGECKVACSRPGIICRGAKLATDEKWDSPSRNVYVIIQNDGNFVMYGSKKGSGGGFPDKWATGANDKLKPGRAEFQESNCELILSRTGSEIPSPVIGEKGKEAKPENVCDDSVYMAMQDDCNFVMYNKTGHIWNTGQRCS